MSRTQIEKLGRRLVASERPAADDVELLNELLVAYREVLTATAERVERATGLPTTSRVKTRSTTREKLLRQPNVGLPAIQDLAGTRIVLPGGRNDQDEVLALLISAFSDERKQPKVVDRRQAPSHGYRAVHLIAFPAGVPVEVQVRTRWQHEWAELNEKIADRLGRGIRYGESVQLPERLLAKPPPIRDAYLELAKALTDWARATAGLIAKYEEVERQGVVDAIEWTEVRSALEDMRGSLSYFE